MLGYNKFVTGEIRNAEGLPNKTKTKKVHIWLVAFSELKVPALVAVVAESKSIITFIKRECSKISFGM